MKGIILAGGMGTRLWPVTLGVSKQLLPVYNKPMVYYPLSVLMLAGIRDILVITRPEDQASFRNLLGDGARLGLSISYTIQPKPEGLPQAFVLAKDFIGDDRCALVLGDNIFFGHGLPELLREAGRQTVGASIFTYVTRTPEAYGVLVRDEARRPMEVVEKPRTLVSNEAITGLYFFGPEVVEMASSLKPSVRGETEITDLIRTYVANGTLAVQEMGRGYAWFDSGTHESLLQASIFVQAIEERQGLAVACLEEIALRMGFIGLDELHAIAASISASSYGAYVHQLSQSLKGKVQGAPSVSGS
ncbi:glucose-1-phosphate thymidylyltransferase [Paramagnetospirillum marisnigri]|uniref:Glucose-1-phosphate thymidylyltransferase n=1 Tax=Paramagnetospirillum marisnigri TaxID=1285242 RepID=A0A178MYA9_9PROT|nr:glucose-1-phosphate thymidylyltransferase RfbA [Paramagnetospirillum marisnigri]OAN54663.1 glucose-1-phosphate thymidylyltransferase [Paramagnetospirillum marisnigri]